MRNDFTTRSKPLGMAKPIYLFYSAEAVKRGHGYNVGIVPDDKGGKKRVYYTLNTTDPKASKSKWPDQKLVWEGSRYELEYVATVASPARKDLNRAR